jgi:hypothetical protein
VEDLLLKDKKRPRHVRAPARSALTLILAAYTQRPTLAEEGLVYHGSVS